MKKIHMKHHKTLRHLNLWLERQIWRMLRSAESEKEKIPNTIRTIEYFMVIEVEAGDRIFINYILSYLHILIDISDKLKASNLIRIFQNKIRWSQVTLASESSNENRFQSGLVIAKIAYYKLYSRPGSKTKHSGYNLYFLRQIAHASELHLQKGYTYKTNQMHRPWLQ